LSGAAPRLVIHGGAGPLRPLDAATRRAIRAALAAALRAGQVELAAGRSALDAVTAALVVLEDAPQFNAGRGAVYSHEGRIELDAAIMDGATLRAGAVAGLRRVKNPVRLARAVMERSAHVLLAGSGAEEFARETGIECVDPAWFHTEERWQALQRALRGDDDASAGGPRSHGTVGAVALDAQGNLAAATSTGGLTNKRWGRIGDSPLIGAGTYAQAHCAVSGTGLGEVYIRCCAAYEICSRVARGEAPAAAAAAVINGTVPALGGEGGAIVLGADGRFATPFNTARMYRGWIDAAGEPQLAIGADEGGAALASLTGP